MAKKTKMKADEEVANERENLIRQMTETIMAKGEELGNDIIDRMKLGAVDPVVLGTAAVGLAKAVAMVKDIARRTGVEIDKLYKSELAHYSSLFEQMEPVEEKLAKK